jgi:hypothetical protein
MFPGSAQTVSDLSSLADAAALAESSQTAHRTLQAGVMFFMQIS